MTLCAFQVKLCGGDIVNGDINDCPYAARLLAVENIPTFLGGKDTEYSAILDPEKRRELHGDEEDDLLTPEKSAAATPDSKSSKKKKKKGKK